MRIPVRDRRDLAGGVQGERMLRQRVLGERHRTVMERVATVLEVLPAQVAERILAQRLWAM